MLLKDLSLIGFYPRGNIFKEGRPLDLWQERILSIMDKRFASEPGSGSEEFAFLRRHKNPLLAFACCCRSVFCLGMLSCGLLVSHFLVSGLFDRLGFGALGDGGFDHRSLTRLFQGS